MEIIEIKSTHSLITSITDQRPAEAHSYQVNCSQYVSTYHDWQRNIRTETQAMGVMTLAFERIWITPEESQQIAAAIRAASSPVMLD